MPRRLSDEEIADLLAADVPCRLATVDPDGFPRITPLWFVWADGAFWMTSLADRRHLADLRRDPHAGLCVDIEQPPAGHDRPNRQVYVRGFAKTFPDEGGDWTRRITVKYVPGATGRQHAEARAAQPRTVVRLEPSVRVAFGHP
jgi:PPOX class probable F420-dependent enzyme